LLSLVSRWTTIGPISNPSLSNDRGIQVVVQIAASHTWHQWISFGMNAMTQTAPWHNISRQRTLESVTHRFRPTNALLRPINQNIIPSFSCEELQVVVEQPSR
jgi:hypothetical protein